MNRIAIMRLLGEDTAIHQQRATKLSIDGNYEKAAEEDEKVRLLGELALYINDHKEVGDYE